MLAARLRNLLGRLSQRWRACVFLLALVSFFFLPDRLQVEERRAAAGRDLLAEAFDAYDNDRPAAAARIIARFLERYPRHRDRGRAHFLLALCRLEMAREDKTSGRYALALESLHAAEDEGYPPLDVRAKRLEVARTLRDLGFLWDALAELEDLSVRDASLHLEVVAVAESLIPEVDPARVAAAAAVGLPSPGPAAGVERLSALQRAMRSPMLEKALAALEKHAKGGEEAHWKALARRGGLYLRLRFYSEAVDALSSLLAEVEGKLATTPPGAPWPRALSDVAREAYETRGLVRLGRMRTWGDPERARREFLLAVNDLARAEELARRDQDLRAAERTGYRIARAYQVHGELPGAVARYQRLLARAPSPVAQYACYARLGQIFLARGDEEKGLGLLARGLSRVSPGALSDTGFPDLPAPSLLLASFPGERRDARRLEAAAGVAESFLAHDATDAALLEILGAVRRRLGEIATRNAEDASRRGQAVTEIERLREEARSQFERAARAFATGADATTGPRAIRMRHAAGVSFARAVDPFRAIEHLTVYLDICPKDDPGQPEALYELARAELAKGNDERALLLFDRLNALYPNNALFTYRSRLDVAEVYRARGDLETAIRSLRNLLTDSDRILPTSQVWKQAKFEIGHLRYELARRLRAEGQVQRARDAFRAAQQELNEALTFFPDEAKPGILALDLLARIAAEDGEHAKSLDLLERLLALGEVADEEGNAAKVEEPYATVCELARVRRADCLFCLGRLEDAADAYQEAFRQVIRREEALDCLHRQAVCELRLGRGADAARTLDQARGVLEKLVAARAIDEARRARWQSLLDQGTSGLLTWQGPS